VVVGRSVFEPLRDLSTKSSAGQLALGAAASIPKIWRFLAFGSVADALHCIALMVLASEPGVEIGRALPPRCLPPSSS
jgi:hypothetical protein